MTRDLGRELARAFEKRQAGNYDHEATLTTADAEAVLRAATDLVQTLRRMPS